MSHRIQFPKPSVEVLESRIAPATMLALTNNNLLLRFDAAAPDTIEATVPITGLGAGESLVAMDFDPQSGLLHALAIGADSQGKIYRLNAGTRAATFLSALQAKPLDDAPYTGLSGNHFSLDFAVSSLSVGEVRIISDAGQQLHLTDIASGIVETQPAPHYISTDVNSGTQLAISGANYNNTRPDGFFGIDVVTDRVVFSYPKTRIDLGEYSTYASLGVDASGPVGMDLDTIARIRYASLNVNGTNGLYEIKDTGATLVNTIGNGTTVIRDIALADTKWVGLGENNLWSNPANWGSGLAPNAESNIVIKSNGGVLETVNDFAPFSKFRAIRLDGQNVVSGSAILIESDLFVAGEATVNFDIRIGQGSPAGFSPLIGTAPESRAILNGVVDLAGHFLEIGGQGSTTFTAGFTGLGSLELSGAAAKITTIHGDPTDSQNIDVEAGVLFLTGDNSGRAITVSIVGHFAGGSPISTLYSSLDGIVAPGGSEIGSVVVENWISLHETTKFELQLDGTGAQPKNDFIQFNGDDPILLRGELLLSDLPGSKPGSRFILLENEGGAVIEEGFAGLEEGEIIVTDNHRYWFTYQGGDGNDIELVQLPEVLISGDGKTATFTDVDGDLVKVTVSQGTLAPENFFLQPHGGTAASELVRLNLTALPDGTKITIKATPQDFNGDRRLDGDGYVNVGSIDASGVILGDVLVDGNLGQISAGKAVGQLGAKSLSVHTLGRLDAFEYDLAGQSQSNIVGSLGKLTVISDVSEAYLNVQGDIGPITIGGSLLGGAADNSGKIFATGSIASIKLRGNVQGSTGELSGVIQADGAVGSLTLGGSIRGGAEPETGIVIVGGKLGALNIGGDLVAGEHFRSGSIVVSSDLGNATIKGSIRGGDGEESASLVVFGTVGRVTVGHSMDGGSGENSGSLIAGADIQSLKVGGTLSGDVISLGGELKQLTVAGSLLGSEADRLVIAASSIGRIVANGDARFADIASESTIASVSITGQADSIGIFAKGKLQPAKAKNALAISAVKIGGSFVGSRIAAGYSFADEVFSNPDVTIGSVSVGGDFIQSDITAGIDSGDAHFGNSDDRVIGNRGDQAILSSIASITIKGQAHGNGASDQHFGVIAESIGKVRLGRTSLPTTSGLDQFVVGQGSNLHFREEVLPLIS